MDNHYIRLHDRAVLRITGSDAYSFLQGIITNDIHKVTNEQAIYSALLTPQGKFLADFFIASYKEALYIDVRAEDKALLLQKLKMYKLRSEVTIEDVSDSYSVVAIIGKDSAVRMKGGTERGNATSFCFGVAFIDPRHSNMHVRMIALEKDITQNLGEVGLIEAEEEIYEALRIERAIIEGGKDIIREQDFPLVYGLEQLQAIDFHKGCYVGQEVTARTKHRGAVRKAVYHVETQASSLPKKDTEITVEGKQVGILRSYYASKGIALLRSDAIEKALANQLTIMAGTCELADVRKAFWLSE